METKFQNNAINIFFRMENISRILFQLKKECNYAFPKIPKILNVFCFNEKKPKVPLKKFNVVVV